MNKSSIKSSVFSVVILLYITANPLQLSGQNSKQGIQISFGSQLGLIETKGTNYNKSLYGNINTGLSGEIASISYFWNQIDITCNMTGMRSFSKDHSQRIDFRLYKYEFNGSYGFSISTRFINEVRPFIGFGVLDYSEVTYTNTKDVSIDMLSSDGSSGRFTTNKNSYLLPIGVSVGKYLWNEKYWKITVATQLDIPINKEMNPIFKASQFFYLGFSLSRKLYVGKKSN